MPNFNEVEVKTSLGLKCSGEQYAKLFRACYNHVAQNGKNLKTTDEARAMFWKKWDEVSAPFHTGTAGISKYSAPFLAGISKAFTVPAAKSAEKAS